MLSLQPVWPEGQSCAAWCGSTSHTHRQRKKWGHPNPWTGNGGREEAQRKVRDVCGGTTLRLPPGRRWGLLAGLCFTPTSPLPHLAVLKIKYAPLKTLHRCPPLHSQSLPLSLVPLLFTLAISRGNAAFQRNLTSDAVTCSPSAPFCTLPVPPCAPRS